MSKAMYTVQPFYKTEEPVQISNVMYSVKNYHDDGGNSMETECASTDPVVALEQRQEAILRKLESLQLTLNQLKGRYDSSAVGSAKSAGNKSPSKPVIVNSQIPRPNVKISSPLGNGIHDIVISADPDKPPLSLFVMYELLQQQFQVLATSYVHSSVVSLDPRLRDAIQGGSQVNRGDHQIALSVIWKKLDRSPQLMISPTKQSVVTGEVNIARYLNRILNTDFDADNVMGSTYMDEWLDVADMQLFNGNSKQRAAAVKNINVRLKRNEWMFGSSLSFVDMVMWSALHQTGQASGAPEHIKRWMKDCANNTLFQTAVGLLN